MSIASIRVSVLPLLLAGIGVLGLNACSEAPESDPGRETAALTFSRNEVAYVQATREFTLYWKKDGAFVPIDSPAIRWNRNSSPYQPGWIAFRPVRYSVYRVKVDAQNLAYARMIGESHFWAGANPFGYLSDGNGVHVKLSEMRKLTHLDQPITFRANTQPADKRIVIVKGSAPRVLLVEGTAVVALAPAVLGKAATPTPEGAMRVSEFHLSRNMTWNDSVAPEHPGVGFAVKFGPTGEYLHNSPWWQWRPGWTQGPDATYASGGCANLPDRRWKSFTRQLWDDEREQSFTQSMSFVELAFRWGSTNILCDRDHSGITASESGEDVQSIHWASPCPLWVYSVPSIDRLSDHLPAAAAAAIREQFLAQNAAL